MNIGLAGEVRCVITKADGTVKKDTGFQKNVILNQGLDFFGGGHGSYIHSCCVIGSGNSIPSVEQNTLDNFIKLAFYVSGGSSDYSYVDNGDDLYKMSVTTKYRFTNLDNVNISEVGLSSYSSNGNYYLCTRALLKDSAGNPTTITVLAGETLDIYYKIWRVISTLDNTYVINLLDGEGGAIPYNVIVRPAMVGTNMWNNLTGIVAYRCNVYAQEVELGEITSRPAGSTSTNREVSLAFGDYTPGSYKIVATANYGIDKANINIRSLHSCHIRPFYFFPFQMRFGSVADDSPIVKTDKDTLTIPFEVSWGRYEGTL